MSTACRRHAPLTGEMWSAEDIGRSDRRQMFELLDGYFENATPARFERDLEEKQWCVLLRETTRGAVKGFTTLMRIETVSAGESIVGFFSGDTIVHREYWGETALIRQWAEHVFRQASAARADFVYWFLISSGYKTYRFLPLFFKKFYPNHGSSTPAAVERHRETLASAKFGPEFDSGSGIVRFREPTPLRPGIADVTAERLKDPHVAFYCGANPGHGDGDQLVCLAEISAENLTRAAFRFLGA